jgi:hypothetical protein
MDNCLSNNDEGDTLAPPNANQCVRLSRRETFLSRDSNHACSEPSICTSSPRHSRRRRGRCGEGSLWRRSVHRPSAIIQPRSVSRETAQPCSSASFSATSVGPKSAYRSLASDIARSRTSAGSRLLLGRPRCLDTRLVAPSCLRPRNKRKICRRRRPISSHASVIEDDPTEPATKPQAD